MRLYIRIIMMTVAIMGFVGFGGLFFSSAAHATSQKDLYFVLKGMSSPADVTQDVPAKKSGPFMRLPDRGSIDRSTSKDGHQAKRIWKNAAAHIVRLTPASQVASQTNPPALKFKPTKISGVVRLPRVRFSGLGPSVELREDMPSLDFTAKSLKDGGL